MNIITLDFETYYDDKYMLSKMTTEAYVRDPRFEVHGVAVRWNEYPDAYMQDTIWYGSEDIKPTMRSHHYGVLYSIDWDNTAVLCHHAQFDGLILSHHYGIKPKMFLDTLSMARLLIGNHLSVSLKSLADHFNLGVKDIPYDLFKGKHWHELTPQVQQQVARGACTDVSLTWDLFQKLAAGSDKTIAFPRSEYALVDATVRMFTNPVLEGDTDLLAQIWQKEEAAKRALLDELEITVADLRKQWKFAELLRAQGVEPEQKPGKPKACESCMYDGQSRGAHLDGSTCLDCDGKGETARWLYSFAKTDDFMRDLLDHEDDTIRLLAEAKLAAHSNGVQTRTSRLGWMSTRGPMCVYLNYAGTHLAGWSGGDKVNFQNLKRGGPIGKAIGAPKGHKVIIVDASQVECRLLETVAGEEAGLEEFRRGEDPYTKLASKFYHEEIYKPKPGDPRQFEMEEKRGTGKQLRLSCGYGAGADTIVVTAAKGIYGPPVYLTKAQGLEARNLYRGEKPGVVHLWDQAGDVLKKMAAGMEFDWNVVHIKDKTMIMPGGVPLHYDSLEWHDDGEDKGWRLRTRRNGWTRIWGSKFVENLIQALRNVLIKEAWLRCSQAGLDMVTMEHDKLVSVVREHEAEAAFAFMKQEMSRPPAWLPNVPLDSEGYISSTFAKE